MATTSSDAVVHDASGVADTSCFDLHIDDPSGDATRAIGDAAAVAAIAAAVVPVEASASTTAVVPPPPPPTPDPLRDEITLLAKAESELSDYIPVDPHEEVLSSRDVARLRYLHELEQRKYERQIQRHRKQIEKLQHGGDFADAEKLKTKDLPELLERLAAMKLDVITPPPPSFYLARQKVVRDKMECYKQNILAPWQAVTRAGCPETRTDATERDRMTAVTFAVENNIAHGFLRYTNIRASRLAIGTNVHMLVDAIDASGLFPHACPWGGVAIVLPWTNQPRVTKGGVPILRKAAAMHRRLVKDLEPVFELMFSYGVPCIIYGVVGSVAMSVSGTLLNRGLFMSSMDLPEVSNRVSIFYRRTEAPYQRAMGSSRAGACISAVSILAVRPVDQNEMPFQPETLGYYSTPDETEMRALFDDDQAKQREETKTAVTEATAAPTKRKHEEDEDDAHRFGEDLAAIESAAESEAPVAGAAVAQAEPVEGEEKKTDTPPMADDAAPKYPFPPSTWLPPFPRMQKAYLKLIVRVLERDKDTKSIVSCCLPTACLGPSEGEMEGVKRSWADIASGALKKRLQEKTVADTKPFLPGRGEGCVRDDPRDDYKATPVLGETKSMDGATDHVKKERIDDAATFRALRDRGIDLGKLSDSDMDLLRALVGFIVFRRSFYPNFPSNFESTLFSVYDLQMGMDGITEIVSNLSEDYAIYNIEVGEGVPSAFIERQNKLIQTIAQPGADAVRGYIHDFVNNLNTALQARRAQYRVAFNVDPLPAESMRDDKA